MYASNLSFVHALGFVNQAGRYKGCHICAMFDPVMMQGRRWQESEVLEKDRRGVATSSATKEKP